MKTYVIAEAGVNHNGSIQLAKQLIEAARKAGADAIKFQSFKAERLVTQTAEKAEYQKGHSPSHETQFEMIRKLELSEEGHQALIEHSRKLDIDFLSSPFDEQSADFLDRYGVRQFKIPSGEITNHPFLLHVARKMKRMILSTGMSTLAEVDKALDIVYSTGNRDVVLLHCVTEYPAPVDQINLSAMLTMKHAFKVPIGYSDHTMGNEITIAAVALGAEVIEKHFTIDKNLEGPDHKASLEPEELKRMILSIRNVEKALGDGIKKPAFCELENLKVARKSIIAASKIKKGDLLTARNLTIKRPGTGISPIEWFSVLGRKAARDFEEDELIDFS